MSPEMSKQLTEVITLAKDNVAAGVEFLQIQCPLLAEEIIRWQIVSSAGGIAACLALIVLCLRYGLTKKNIDLLGEGADAAFIICAISVATLTTSVILLLCNVTDLLQAIVAPRMVLLDYVGGLL